MNKVSYSEEYKDQVLKRASEIGVSKAAKEFNLSIQTIYNWRNREKREEEIQEAEQTVETNTSEEPEEYNAELIKRVLMRAEESGAKMAAFEFSVPLEKVEEWIEEDKAEKMAIEEKTAESETQPEENTSTQEPSTPVEEPKKRTGRYSNEFKAEVLKRVEEIGLKEAAAEHIVPFVTVEKWVKEAGKESKADEVTVTEESTERKTGSENKRGKRYSDEFKRQAVARAAEIGLSKAAAEFDVTVSSILKWRMNIVNTVDVAKDADETGKAAEISVDDVKSVEETGAAVEIPVEDDKEETTKTETLIKRMTVQSIEVENAVLKAENAALEEQVEKLRKALSELM